MNEPYQNFKAFMTQPDVGTAAKVRLHFGHWWRASDLGWNLQNNLPPETEISRVGGVISGGGADGASAGGGGDPVVRRATRNPLVAGAGGGGGGASASRSSSTPPSLNVCLGCKCVSF